MTRRNGFLAPFRGSSDDREARAGGDLEREQLL